MNTLEASAPAPISEPASVPEPAPARANRRLGGRERRDPNARPTGPAYIKRVIPTYEVLGEESLLQIEATADRILAEIGLVTPPFGLNLFTIHGVLPKFSVMYIARSSLPFLAVMILMVWILIFFPDLAMWLPRQLY